VHSPAAKADLPSVRFIAKALAQPVDRAELRRARREAVSSNVRCNLGDIVDLSAAGMRVITRKPLDGDTRVTLLAQRAAVQLSGKIAWSKRMGFRRHMVGVEFVQVDAHAEAMLTRLISEHRPRRAA
jgi:hypothetical protein